MSVYRLIRFTAIVAVLRRYRARLARLLFALATALVTAWLYADVASYLQAQHPQWSGIALAIKTGVIYLLLFYGIWEIQRMLRGDTEAQPANRPASRNEAQPSANQASPLDELVDKPKLRSRRDAILDEHESR